MGLLVKDFKSSEWICGMLQRIMEGNYASIEFEFGVTNGSTPRKNTSIPTKIKSDWASITFLAPPSSCSMPFGKGDLCFDGAVPSSARTTGGGILPLSPATLEASAAWCDQRCVSRLRNQSSPSCRDGVDCCGFQ